VNTTNLYHWEFCLASLSAKPFLSNWHDTFYWDVKLLRFGILLMKYHLVPENIIKVFRQNMNLMIFLRGRICTRFFMCWFNLILHESLQVNCMFFPFLRFCARWAILKGMEEMQISEASKTGVSNMASSGTRSPARTNWVVHGPVLKNINMFLDIDEYH